MDSGITITLRFTAMKLAHHSMTWGGRALKSGEKLDFDRMLAEVREIGYTGIELGGDESTHGSPESLLNKLAANDLELAAWCSFVTALPDEKNAESYRRSINFAEQVGATVMMVCGGWLPEPRRTTFDRDYQLFAGSLRPALEYAAEHRQKLAFHPHMDCIVETDEEIRRLLSHIPDLDLCIDCGHLAGVRVDAAAVVREHGTKTVHTHVKDYHVGQRKFAELGQGDVRLDFHDFFTALREVGFDGWLVVERDDPPIPAAESARISFDFIAPLAAPFLS